MARKSNFDVREDVMAAARATVERDGYNALSFRTLADEVGVKSATVHYHFKTKGDLAEALVARYREDLLKILEPYNDASYDDAMAGYVGLFRSFFADKDKMCLGGMMSAEVTSLPEPACQEIARFMTAHVDWLAEILSKKHPRMSADKRQARARAIFAALEGAMLIARGNGSDVTVFDGIVDDYRAAGLLA
jgi:TetR/AcrR family transcriptional regulator, transcriptional repressor for nem operon